MWCRYALSVQVGHSRRHPDPLPVGMCCQLDVHPNTSIPLLDAPNIALTTPEVGCDDDGSDVVASDDEGANDGGCD